jgi:VanZ family protein
MPPSDLPRFRIPNMDKIAHFVFFFVQSVLLSLLLRYRTKRSYLDIIILSTFQAFLYGGVIEFLQNEFFNRTGDLYDLMADTLGGLFGAVTYPVFFRLFNKRAKKYT